MSESEIKQEQRTTKAYVTGFLLSLLFTFIPYYLVVHHLTSGMTLLSIILAIGVIQMIVQVTFFLHIGRGPNPKWNLYFFLSTIGIILAVVGGSILIIGNLHYNMSPQDQVKKLTNDEGIYQIGGTKTGACEGQHANHQVVIKNGQVSPLHTVAGRCDTLTFINEDSRAREIAFGSHPRHDAYAGESELMVRKGQGKTITLSESGSYQFHDHLQEETAGDFLVTP